MVGEDEGTSWEHRAFGKTIISRMKTIGVDTMDYRSNTTGMEPTDPTLLRNFSRYVHKTGAQMLQMRLTKEAEEDSNEQDKLKKRQVKLNRIVRRKIKADEMDDDLVGITMDKEWDTSLWSQEEIVAGCEALSLIFQTNEEVSDEKKAQAILMMEKLVFRHDSARDWLKNSLDPLIAKAASKKYRGGQSAAQLDILHILHGCRNKFSRNLSEYKFIERICDLLVLEAKLAATLIQHALRTHIDNKRPRSLLSVEEGFGSTEELMRMRYRALNERSNELSAKWDSMHWHLTKDSRQIIGGLRGPVHIGPVYMQLLMDIVNTLVSESGGDLAHSNRIDFVHHHAIILMIGYMSSPQGQLALPAVRVLSQISKCADSLEPMLYGGIGRGVLKYIKYVSKSLKQVVSNTFLDAVNTIQRLAVHASGVYRAQGGYDFIKPKYQDVEQEDYRFIQSHFTQGLMTEIDIIKLLSPTDLIYELMSTMLNVNSIVTVRCIMNCLYTLSCSHCLINILIEVTALGGKALMFIVERLEDTDLTIATYALSLLLQLATRPESREALIISNFNHIVEPLIFTSGNYSRLSYQRALLIAAAMSRFGQIRAYDPSTFPQKVVEIGELEHLICMDLLLTLKQPSPGTAHNYASLALLPTNYEAAVTLSTNISLFNPMAITDFLVHPEDEQYFYSLQWDTVAAVCAILEGMSITKNTAASMFSSGTVIFLSATLKLCKFELLGKPMSERRVSLILNGAVAACNCLCNLCYSDRVVEESPFAHLTHNEKFFDNSLKFNTATLDFDCLKHNEHINATIIIHGFECMDMSGSCSFILSTMTTTSHNISETNKGLAENAAMAAARLLESYSAMLVHIDPNHKELLSLMSSGPILVKILGNLKQNFGITAKMMRSLKAICKVLASLTSSQATAAEAIIKWKIMDSFAVHLPPPLSGLMGDPGFKTRELSYKMGLGYLSAPYFDALTSLCKLESGKTEMLNGGYLRRALDKLHILQGELESPSELLIWKKLIQAKRPVPDPSEERLALVACLHLIDICVNFHSTSTGNANDLILSPSYDIVGVCKSIMEPMECPRTDIAYLMSLTLMANMSSDYARMVEPFAKHKLLKFLHNELKGCEILPPLVVEKCLEIVYNISCGPQSMHLTKYLKSMKETFARVQRLLPQYFKQITDINFRLLDSEMGPGARQSQRPDTQQRNHNKEADEEMSIALSRVEIEVGKDSDGNGHSLPHGAYGSYNACGVSSCGSLRFPGSPGTHGLFSTLTDVEVHDQLAHLPQLTVPRVSTTGLTENDKRNELYLLEVSRLSARDRGFRDMLVRNKSSQGFTDKPLFNLSGLRATVSASKKSDLYVDTTLTSSFLDNEDELLALGIIRVDSAAPSTRQQSRGSGLGQRTRVGTTSSRPSSSAILSPSLKSPKKTTASPIMRTVDLQDVPEFKSTRPVMAPSPSTLKPQKSSSSSLS